LEGVWRIDGMEGVCRGIGGCRIDDMKGIEGREGMEGRKDIDGMEGRQNGRFTWWTEGNGGHFKGYC